MADWLIIKLEVAPTAELGAHSPVTWMHLRSDGQALSLPAETTLQAVVSLARERRLAVIVPATEVMSLCVELPARAGAKLLQAVPFAVEDQLADDVEALHFAIGARGAGGRTAVNVVDRALFTRWLTALREAGLEPDAVYSEATLLPANVGQIVALLDERTLHARLRDGTIASIPVDSLDTAMELLIEGSAATDGEHAVLLYATESGWSRFGEAAEAWHQRLASLRIQLLPQGALPLLAQAVGSAHAVNLLQGEFELRRTGTGAWQRWRWAAGLAAAALLLTVGSGLWELSRLQAERQRVAGQYAEVLNATFGPGTSDNLSAGRARLAEALQRARGGNAAGGELLPALAALAQALAATPGARIQTLSYQDGALEMRVKADNASGLESISASLRAAGWEAQLQGGSATATAYEGRIRVLASGAST